MSRVSKIWSELMRRNVFKMVVLYVVAAWLVLQMADVLFELLVLPDWSLRLVFGILLLGFPVALIASWVFELTPQGIKRDEHVDRSDPRYLSNQKVNTAIIGVLAVAVALLLIDRFWDSVENGENTVAVVESPPVALQPDVLPSIAVLPFVNMSADVSNEYFSDGLSETLTHMLAQLSGLRVAARTSAFQFKEQMVDVEEIGRALNVTTVLEGSVRKAGDTLRVTAQLINVDDGYHLWSGTYDRELDNVFVIQDEIARQVVDALKPQLLDEEVERLAARPTESIDAYNAYLLGRQQLNIGSYVSLPRAEQFFTEAIARDPSYSLAYAAKAATYSSMFATGMFGKDEYLARAEPLASKAAALDPELGEVYPVLAELAMVGGDEAKGEALFNKAIELSPNFAPAYAMYATLAVRKGRISEARELVARGLAVDPLSVPLHMASAGLAQQERDYPAVHAQYARIRELEPGNPNGYSGAALLHWQLGEHDQAIQWLQRSIAIDPEDHELPGYMAIIYLDLGNLSVAERWVEQAEALGPGQTMSVAARVAWLFRSGQRAEAARAARAALMADLPPRALSHGVFAKVLLAATTDSQGAEELLQLLVGSLPGFDALLKPEPELTLPSAGLTGTAVVLLRQAGREDQAEKLLQAAENMMPQLTQHQMENADFILMEIHALAGNQELALERFEALLERHFWALWYISLQDNRSLAAIVDDPRFLAGLERLRAELARLADLTGQGTATAGLDVGN